MSAEPREPTRAAPPADAEVGLDALRMGPFTGRQLALLLAITLLAGVLRLMHLGEWSIWVDEAHTWRDVTMPAERFLHGARKWYPTSFLGLRWLMNTGILPGFTEGWLRLPFAFFGIVSVPLLALCGKQLVGQRAALLSALFLAINPWHIYWSQNARAYSLVFFFAVLGAGMFWRGVDRGSRWWMAGGWVAALIGGSCHFTGHVLLPVFVVYWVLAKVDLRGRRFWLILCLGGIALTVLLQLVTLLPPIAAFRAAKPDPSLVHLVQTAAFYFRLPLICVAALGVWLLFQRRLQGRVLFLACWALLPLLLLGIVGSTMFKVTARYALSSLPAVLLLAGAASVRIAEVLSQGLAGLRRFSRVVPATVIPLILCLDMGAYDFLYYTSQHGDRGRWREACKYVLDSAGDEPVVVCTTNEPSLLYYLRPNHHRSLEQALEDTGTTVYGIEERWVYGTGLPEHEGWNGETYFRSMANNAQGSGARLFVVAQLPELDEKDRDGSMRRALHDRLELVRVLPCWVGPKDATIYVWRWPDKR